MGGFCFLESEWWATCERVAALVLPPSLRFGATRRRTHVGCNRHGSPHQLMVSSGAERRVRRTMGGERGADAVLLTQVFDIGVGGGLHVLEGAEIALPARDRVVQSCGRHEFGECHEAHRPAEAAVGFSPDCEVEAGFGAGEELVETLEGVG